MPSSTTVESFIQLVEAGQTVEAMERFYADHATMQENENPRRRGKVALVKHEEGALASIAALKVTCVRSVFMAGESAVIRWIFEIQDKKGKAIRFGELALQRREGGFMVEEKFFYDPGQFK